MELKVNKRASAVVAVVMVAVACAHGAAAQGSAPRPLQRVIDSVVQQGPDNALPAHLSLVLGINNGEQTTAVKQAVMRDGSTVRTFNVRTGNHDDVVMMVYDEQSRSTKAYLVSPEGKLRKAVAYQAGAAATERSAAEARVDLANELRFWTELMHRPGVAK